MKEKKKSNNFKKIFFVILAICAIIIVAVFFAYRKKASLYEPEKEKVLSLYDTNISQYVKETADGIKLNTSNVLNTNKLLGDFTISEIQLTSESGVTTLLAVVTNNSQKTTPLSTIRAKLLKENGDTYCEVSGVLKSLNPGESGKLNISMSGNFVDAYDVIFGK